MKSSSFHIPPSQESISCQTSLLTYTFPITPAEHSHTCGRRSQTWRFGGDRSPTFLYPNEDDSHHVLFLASEPPSTPLHPCSSFNWGWGWRGGLPCAGLPVETTLNRKCARFKRGSKIFRLDLINETALCYLWPLVKELDRVCVIVCARVCTVCMCSAARLLVCLRPF